VPAAGIAGREFGRAECRDVAAQAGCPTQRRIVQQHRNIITRQHRVELDCMKSTREPDSQRSQRVLRRERSATAVCQHARPGPRLKVAHDGG
jgi:hypothetical protein